jgi:hypothetical protein
MIDVAVAHPEHTGSMAASTQLKSDAPAEDRATPALASDGDANSERDVNGRGAPFRQSCCGETGCDAWKRAPLPRPEPASE